LSETVPTPRELRETLVQILTGAAGGTEARWRKAVGEVEKLSLAFNIRTNWAVRPTGNADELSAIAKAVDVVRTAHPYVAG
jgi:hypothetical protein